MKTSTTSSSRGGSNPPPNTRTSSKEGRTEPGDLEAKNNEESVDGLDEVLAAIGMGRWHFLPIVCIFMAWLTATGNSISSPFIAPSLPFRCFSPYQDTQNSSHFDNKCYLSEGGRMLTQKSPNASWGVALPDEVDDGGRGCPYGYEYDTSVFTSTVASEVSSREREEQLDVVGTLVHRTFVISVIFCVVSMITGKTQQGRISNILISQWNLVCDRSVLQPLFQMVASSGTIVANLISGSVADIYGRRVPINIGAILNVASAIIIIFSGHYWMVLVGRFFFGFSTSFVIWPTFNMAMEETPPKYRSLMGMVLGIPFSVWVVAMSGVAYLIRDWRNLQAAVSAPVLLFIPCLLFLDESPRWLMLNDRGEEAVRVLQKAARLHKAEIPSSGTLKAFADEMFQATKKRKLSSNTTSVNWMVDLKQGILQFVRTPAMRTITLLMPIVWFMQNLSYIGILLNANNFSSENPFVYVAMNGAIEIPAILLFTPLTFRFGRRIVTTLGFLLAGLCLLALVLIPEDLQVLQWVTVAMGFTATSGAFQVNLVYVSELFPTTLRVRGVSLCNLVGGLGVLVAPFIVKFLAGTAVPPPLVFGTCCLVASVLLLFFPETNGQTLCEVVQDVEDRRRAQRSLSSSCCFASVEKKDPGTIPNLSGIFHQGFVPDSMEPVPWRSSGDGNARPGSPGNNNYNDTRYKDDSLPPERYPKNPHHMPLRHTDQENIGVSEMFHLHYEKQQVGSISFHLHRGKVQGGSRWTRPSNKLNPLISQHKWRSLVKVNFLFFLDFTFIPSPKETPSTMQKDKHQPAIHFESQKDDKKELAWTKRDPMENPEGRRCRLQKKSAGGEDDLDAVMAALGMGRWHTIIMACNITVFIILGLNLVGSTFMSPAVPFRCAPENASALAFVRNVSSFDSKCIPDDNSGESPIPSSVVADGAPPSPAVPGSASFGSCPHGFEYDTSVFTSTVAMEWDLVCEHAPILPLFQTIYSAGSMLGGVLGGAIADRFGRRMSLRFGAVLCVVGTLAVAFARQLVVILMGRFFIGLMCSVMLYPAFNLALETATPKHRAIVGMLLGIPYSINTISVAIIAYFIRSWRTFYLISSIPALIFMPAILLVDESPRWLMQNNRGEEGVQILQKVAKLHGAKIPPEEELRALAEEMLKDAEEARRRDRTAAQDLKEVAEQFLLTPAMRTITLLMPCVWFLQNMSYLGILLNANNFSTDNPFLYVALNSIAEIAAVLLSTSLTTHLGRRLVISVGFFTSGLCSLSLPYVSNDIWWLQWVLVIVSFLSVAGAYQVNFIYTPELFPTTVRARGSSLCSLAGDIGYVVAPFITNLLTASSSIPSSSIFGVGGLIASLMVPFLPETNNETLCEVVQDVEARSRNQRSCWGSLFTSSSRPRPSSSSNLKHNVSLVSESEQGGGKVPAVRLKNPKEDLQV
ncbi:uncharacterized protein LOC143030054 [Oratosquilla oratoria]|uniref:uncharacterized protein LOC143030054 n=1 Tax=Oratosquilla oratoria TaxID=337810 RepID=UPI003F76AD9E